MSDVDADLSIAHERRLHDTNVQQLTADVHLRPVIVAGWQPRQGDGSADRRRETAGSDLAFSDTVDDDTLVIAQYAFVLQQQADEASCITFLALLLERCAADEITIGRLPGNGPAESRLQR